jgi:hypothetical protein
MQMSGNVLSIVIIKIIIITRFQSEDQVCMLQCIVFYKFILYYDLYIYIYIYIHTHMCIYIFRYKPGC